MQHGNACDHGIGSMKKIICCNVSPVFVLVIKLFAILKFLAYNPDNGYSGGHSSCLLSVDETVP